MSEQQKIEMRRKRREAILAKYNTQQPHAQQPHAQQPQSQQPQSQQPQSQQPQSQQPQQTQPEQRAASPNELSNGVAESNAASNTASNAALNVLKPDSTLDAGASPIADMFAESPVIVQKQLTHVSRGENAHLKENWDDEDGYYMFRVGETLADRFVLLSSYGKGMFSTVVRARDQKNADEEVAIKIVRNNELLHKAGLKEIALLRLLMEKDPEHRRHIIRLKETFEYKNHLCMIFPAMALNLREVLKKYGQNAGLSIEAVQVYAKQLFLSLKHLRDCNILHGDIKPDNILVS